MFGFIKKFASDSSKYIKFDKAVLKKSGRDFANPGRGWYRIYTFRLGNINYNEPDWLYYDDNETLALVLIDISAYSSKNIDSAALNFFGYILGKFREKGKEIILRIVYDTEGKGMEKEPSLFSQVIIHMQQLGGIVKEHAESIFLYQGLFAGSWGEMHTSKFLSDDKLKILYANWKQATENSVKISFRTPVQAGIVTGGTDNNETIGIFDDAIFASPTHLGTFGNFEKEIGVIQKTAAKIPCGGEAVAGENLPSTEETIKLLRDMNISYLNCIHDKKILDYWKGQPMGGYANLYSYISMHLGYRITVKDVKLYKCGNARNPCIKIIMENSGFSCIYYETVLKLVIAETDGNIYEKELPFDAGKLKAGSTAEAVVEHTGSIKKGSRLYVELIRKHDKKHIQFDNEGSTEGVFLGTFQ